MGRRHEGTSTDHLIYRYQRHLRAAPLPRPFSTRPIRRLSRFQPFSKITGTKMVDKSAIDAALAKIELRLARVRAVDDGEAEETDSDRDDDSLHTGVEVARGVTEADVEAIPPEWLAGVFVELHDDGLLVMLAKERAQHSTAVSVIQSAAANHADANGLIYSASAVQLPDSGSTMYPDAVVWHRIGDPAGLQVEALLLHEVEVHHRTFAGLIRVAIKYLDEMPSLQRVVGIKIFPKWNGEHITGLVKFPAVIVVFQRDGEQICVAQMQSFGNASIEPSALDSLVYPDDERFVSFRGAFAHGPPDPQLPDLSVVGLFDELATLLRDLAVQMPFHIQMPREYPPVQLDLKALFVALVKGWIVEQDATRRLGYT